MSQTVEGVWTTETYVVGGKETSVDGVLFLTRGQWSTLYFVPGEQGPWASAEAGRFTCDGQTLTFHHRLVFQGGGGRSLQIDQHAAREERCRVTCADDRLTIDFPSGNTLHLRRVAE